MDITDAAIRSRLQLREDHRWEFKRIEFKGNQPVSPKRSDLADEMTAFANSNGGILVCGVSDDGQLQGMSSEQITRLDRLLVEISNDAIEPPLHAEIYHRELDGKKFILAHVPKGDSVHNRDGRAFIRVGAAKRRLTEDERLRLAQRRAQGRYLWFDQQIVPQTGLGTLSEHLWKPLISVAGADDPRKALTRLRLLALDEFNVLRATVAGILLCTDSPHEWLPQAKIMVTLYRGRGRASGQLDAQEIEGPLPLQIADAVRFVARNMRVAARKTPAREDMPQYSKKAVFEAIVNAVVHRDYSISSRRIRLSMFKNRLEIDSPGQLPNGMTIDAMDYSQSTRNEVLASVFGRLSAGSIPGSEHRRYMMERRGDGVPIIFKETRETAGIEPEYKLANESNLVLILPAAKLELIPSEATVTVHSDGEPLASAEVLVLFPNKTWQRGFTDEAGEAKFDLHTTHLPMTVYAAVPGYSAGLIREWIPLEGGVLLEMIPRKGGGSVIFPNAEGQIPGLYGRLNPIRDDSDRTYLYADNVAIEEGKQQPVPFQLGDPLHLVDASGMGMSITIIDIIGQSALVEYKEVHLPSDILH